jgi:hypothetical protein
MEDLLKEKAEFERQITLNEEQISAAHRKIFYLKKRLKFVEAEIKAEQERVNPASDGDALDEIAEGLG